MAATPISRVSYNLPGRALFRGAGAAAILALGACAMPVPQDVTVRHVQSTETAGNGARWHIFVFDPDEPRDLDTRIRLARAQIGREPGCDWVDRPRSEIEDRTAAQGARYTDTVLAAPLICEG